MAVGLTLATTSGCGASFDGVTGISVTADGGLLGVVMVCGHEITSAGLIEEGDGRRESTRIGEWAPDRPLKAGLTTWSLDSPTAGWTTTRSPGPLADAKAYSLVGWTGDVSWSARSVDFTTADRDRLRPGRVLYEDYSKDGEEVVRLVPLSEFEATACDARSSTLW
ncbi:hypothetical protein OHT52_21855 [Streptomyces sp. NBC_00247]|uniref:hypothetical protein n=1 Tax=Streptomyces sp. NBC_00247 TaxID=2975689 RepID=UPI002E2C8174|nr:hypothetical protein [Streptomyces sp. NBC_00247]